MKIFHPCYRTTINLCLKNNCDELCVGNTGDLTTRRTFCDFIVVFSCVISDFLDEITDIIYTELIPVFLILKYIVVQ